MSNERQNVQVQVPQETFKVEAGLPELPTTGRQGQSKYSSLMEQARALKPGTHFKVPVEVPAGSTLQETQRALVRNIRVAIKRFAPKAGLKVTASGSNQVAIYRDSGE